MFFYFSNKRYKIRRTKYWRILCNIVYLRKISEGLDSWLKIYMISWLDTIIENMNGQGYNGDDNYESMCLFIICKCVPPPSHIKRYDEGDDYFFRNSKREWKKSSPDDERFIDNRREGIRKTFILETHKNTFTTDIHDLTEKMKQLNKHNLHLQRVNVTCLEVKLNHWKSTLQANDHTNCAWKKAMMRIKHN